MGCGHGSTSKLKAVTDWVLGFFKKDELEDILKEAYSSESTEINQELFNKTYSELSKGVDEGFGNIQYGQPNYEFNQQLKHNGAVFSAFKNHQQAKDLQKALTDEKGNKRSFSDFKKATSKITKNYNDRWLNAEYNQAVKSARAAAQWKEYEADADLYPNLRYVESSSSDQRDDHRKLYDIVKPINDSFWSSYLPPNGWGCKCSVEQTNDAPTDGNTPSIKRIPGIPGNAGKIGELFSKSHPYVKNTSKSEKVRVKEQLKVLERKAVRKEGTAWGRKNLQSKQLTLVDKKIEFSKRGINKHFSQFHKNNIDKNLLIYSLKEVFDKAVFVKSALNSNLKKREVKQYHYYKFKFKGEYSYLNIEETYSGKFYYYGITDKIR